MQIIIDMVQSGSILLLAWGLYSNSKAVGNLAYVARMHREELDKLRRS